MAIKNLFVCALALTCVSLVASAAFDDGITLRAVGDKQTITSPNYPDNYPHGVSITHVVKNTKSGNPVYIKKNFVNVGSVQCGDKITVTDVTNSKIYEFCGTRVTGPGLSSHVEGVEGLEFLNSEEIHVKFESNAVDTFKGFSFTVSLEQCSRSQFSCDNGDGCYLPNESCDGTNQCADGTDEAAQYCSPACGKSHFDIKNSNTDRIVGGVFVNRHSLPWQVAFGGCGGTVISDRWILSAAHCFRSGVAQPGQSLATARVGSHDKGLNSDADRSVNLEVERIVCHPKYGLATSFDFDQCLLKTRQTIPFRKNIVPACLPEQGEDPAAGSECMTSGWGNTQAINTPLLKQVFVPVVKRETCGVAYEGRYQITDNMICAGSTNGGIDSCQGDSGGPFICRKPDGSWTVNGIVSWGIGCALPDYPGVYASAGTVSDWIKETMASF